MLALSVDMECFACVVLLLYFRLCNIFTIAAEIPFITLEEHYLDPTVVNASQVNIALYTPQPANVLQELYDVGPKRLTNLAANDIGIQVLSHSPIAYVSPTGARTANDQLHSIVQSQNTNNGTRYAAFALLTVQDTEHAVMELRRTVQQLGFVGALINNHNNGSFYDDPKYWPLFAAAEELDVPIYLHPMYPTTALTSILYQGNYAPSATFNIGVKDWGWHSNTGLHVIRLFSAGVFDAYPNLKLVIGHMGEMVPFQLGRILDGEALLGERKRGLREVWQTNIWITTSGFFTLPPFKCLLDVMPVDRLLFSVDYPFSSNEQGRQFMEDLAKSGLVSDGELEGIAHGNAEKLLRLGL